MHLPPRPPGRSLAAVAVVAVALVVGLCPVSAVRAADRRPVDRAAAIRTVDSSPDGRLIVFWKGDRKPNLSVPLIAAVRSSAYGVRRSVVTASPGQASALAEKLRADPDVVAVVPDVILRATDWPASGDPNDFYYASSQGDLPLIGMTAAWPTTVGVHSVVVAILDTGTTVGHEDLVGTSFVSAHDFTHAPETNDAVDDHGHGTHITGTIAGQANNTVGIAGMAPGVSIMPIKILDYLGRGDLWGLINGIDYARVHGAKVINMSLGGPMDPTTAAAVQPTIDAAYAAGITIVAAAGNDGTDAVEYPCAFVHVICVGATDAADQHPAFSNRNAYVDVSAPGVGIWSTVPGGYATFDGTSMSTPHVAALAGLILSAHPGETVDQVEATILSTAVDLGQPGRDNDFGVGRINAGAAVSLPPPDLIPPVMTGLAAPSLVKTADRSFTATGSATDNVAVAAYEFQTKNGATGTWSEISSQTDPRRTFKPLAFGSWHVAVRAVDAAGHRSEWLEVVAMVPKDVRGWSFTSGTTKRTGARFINGTDTTTSRSGARMTIRFTGSAFYVMGTSAVKHGKLRVTIDGRSWIVDEGMLDGRRATTTTHRVVFFARSLTKKAHTVVITCLATPGRPTIDLDAVAWQD